MENREVAGVVLMVVDAYHLVAEGPLLLLRKHLIMMFLLHDITDQDDHMPT